MWERATGTVTRVGLDAAEPDVSRDGRYVALTSGDQVLLRDRTTGTLTPVSTGTGRHRQPVLSADGSHVALTGPAGVLLWDRAAGTSTLVAAGAAPPRLDADASVVAWAAGDQVSAATWCPAPRRRSRRGRPRPVRRRRRPTP